MSNPAKLQTLLSQLMNSFLLILRSENLSALRGKGFKPAADLEPMFSANAPYGLLLYPENYFALIPDGTEVVGVSGETWPFDYGRDSRDARFGTLAFGFIHPALS